jgi:hypothetical protein
LRLLLASEQTVTHAVEEAAAAWRFCSSFEFGLQLANPDIGLFQCFILNQDGLYQGVKRMGCTTQPIVDRAFGIRIALPVFDLREAIEEIVDEIPFLWGHWSAPYFLVATRIM